MSKLLLILGGLVFSFGALIFGALIGAFFFWLVWNGTIAELFPRSVAFIPATLTLWQAFKLMFLLGVIGKSFQSSVNVESK